MYDFINNKFTMDDYVECFVITMGVLVIVYMFVISRSEPTMVLVITFALVFAFLVIVQKKYKNKYNDKLQDVRGKVDLIKKKLNVHHTPPDDNPSDDKPSKPILDKPKDDKQIDDKPEKEKKHKNIPKCFKCRDKKYVYNWKKMKNDYECHPEPTCESCGGKWCISPQYNGRCVPKDEECSKTPSGQRKKHTSYTLGGQDISNFSEYAANGGSLYKNYMTCMTCDPTKSTVTLDTNQEAKCIHDKDSIYKKHEVDPRYKDPARCLNSPDDEIPGFGCPGKHYRSPNVAPINPDENNGNICQYAPQ